MPVVIYLFWGDGCPHCEKAMKFLKVAVAAEKYLITFKPITSRSSK
jgi:thiol-disulfide isomerase/thioredoxin